MLSRNTTVALAKRGYQFLRTSTAYSTKVPSAQVVVADDGRTLVCWHPKPEFPYEHSLPLPKASEPGNSVLKSLNGKDKIDVSHLEGVKAEIAREELMKMTFTTKHGWFPRLQKKKAKKTPMQRPYL